MDASEVTRRIRERTIYANYLAQKNRIDGGCGSSIRLSNNGGSSFESSLIPSLKEGELFTTPEQRDAILAASACNIVETRDAIYLVGQFENDPITFYAAQDEFAIDLFKNDSSTNWSTFLVKFNLEGLPLWSTRINAVITDNSSNAGTDKPIVHVSSNSTIYVAGTAWFWGAGNYAMYFYNSGSSTPDLTISTDRDATYWFAEYNSEGQVQWANYLRPQGSVERFFMTSDSQDNLYLQIYTNNTFNIYNAADHSTSVQTVNVISDDDVFVIKYDTNGQYQWHSIMAGTDWEGVASIICDRENNVYSIISRYGNSPLDIYGPTNYGSPSFSLGGGDSGNQYHMLIKYDSTGGVLWGTKFTGTENVGRAKMVVDSSNNLYVYGMYQNGTLDIYSQSNLITPAISLANSGQTDTFFVKFSPTGTLVWGTRILGTNNEIQPSLGIDSNNNLYVVGESRSNSVDVYDAGAGSPSRTIAFDGLPNNKIYIIKYNSSGISSWASFMGPFNITMIRNEMKVNADGTIYLTARLHDGNIVNFYDSTGTTPISSMSNTSGIDYIFLVKYDANGAPVWSTTTNQGDLSQLSI